jgi:hypothetical protein
LRKKTVVNASITGYIYVLLCVPALKTIVQMKKLIVIPAFIAMLYISISACAQTNVKSAISLPSASLAKQMAATAMTIWKDSFSLEENRPARWSYDQGVILKGIENIWVNTGDPRYFQYIQRSMDFFVQENGSAIKGYSPGEYNIDHVNNGK